MGHKGAKYVGFSLRDNIVNLSRNSFVFYFPMIQVLTQLNLTGCHIGVQGAKYIADALKNNKVTFNYWFLINFIVQIDQNYDRC